MRAGGRRALELAGVGIDDVDIIDLYSCFPSAVQLGARRPRARHRPSAHPHRWAGLRRRTVEQLHVARHRHGGGRAASRGGRPGVGVGERRLRHQARLRRVRRSSTGGRIPPRPSPGRDRRAPPPRRRQRCERSGDRRGLHGDARPSRRRRAWPGRLPAPRRPPGVGDDGRRRHHGGDGTATSGSTTRSPSPKQACSMPDRPAIILDCDPGHDDAMAIVVAAGTPSCWASPPSPGTPRSSARPTTRASCRELLGIDVPVHSGAERPLVVEASPAAARPRRQWARRRRPAGAVPSARLAPTRWRSSSRPAAGATACGSCRSGRSPTSRWRSAPRPISPRRIAGISLMGGGSFGNRTAHRRVQHLGRSRGRRRRVRLRRAARDGGLDVTHQFQRHARAHRAGRRPRARAAAIASPRCSPSC